MINNRIQFEAIFYNMEDLEDDTFYTARVIIPIDLNDEIHENLDNKTHDIDGTTTILRHNGSKIEVNHLFDEVRDIYNKYQREIIEFVNNNRHTLE